MNHLPPPVAPFPTSQFDIVLIAASAGGIQALGKLLPQLPSDFAAVLIIVMHLKSHRASLLPQVLNSSTSLKVKDARSGELVQVGTIYTAPPDHHLLIKPNRTLYLTRTAKVNFTRPAADCTLQSVAECFGPRAIAVVLTGYGCDGATGIKAIKQHGGLVMVQDPATAAVASMPQAAIDTDQVDWVLPLEEIPQALIKLVQRERTSL